MTTYIDERQENFIEQLLRLIWEGQKDEAIEKILPLIDRNKIEIIDILALQDDQTLSLRLPLATAKTFYWSKNFSANQSSSRSQARISAIALTRAGTIDQSYISGLNIARDVAAALDQTLTRIQVRIRDGFRDNTLDLTSAIISELEQAVNIIKNITDVHYNDLSGSLLNDLRFFLSVTIDFARYIGRTHFRAGKDIVSTLVKSIEDIAYIANIFVLSTSNVLTPDMMEEAHLLYHQKLAEALDEALYLQHQEPSDILDVVIQVLEYLLQGKLRHITLEGEGRITPDILTHQIGPYLQALNGYLDLYAEITGKSFDELRIVQIHNLDAKLEVIGFGDSIRALDEVFNRRKREDEARLREIELQVKGLERDLLQKENEQKYAQMSLEQPIREAEVSSHLEGIKTKAIERQIELRRKILELQQLEDELLLKKQMSYLEEATKFIERIGPNLSFEERFLYITRLATYLQQMDDSNLKARFGSHDAPRPSLPDVPPPGLPKPSK